MHDETVKEENHYNKKISEPTSNLLLLWYLYSLKIPEYAVNKYSENSDTLHAPSCITFVEVEHYTYPWQTLQLGHKYVTRVPAVVGIAVNVRIHP